MRLSDTLVVSLIEDDAPFLVIVDDVGGEEIRVSAEEAFRLVTAVQYFRDQLMPNVPADCRRPPAGHPLTDRWCLVHGQFTDRCVGRG